MAVSVLAHVVQALADHVRALRRAGRSVPPELETVTAALRASLPNPQRPAECACDQQERDAGDVYEPLLLTLPDVARMLAVSRATVERLVAAEDLASVKVGSGRRVRRADLDAYVASLPERSARAAAARRAGAAPRPMRSSA